MRTSATLGKGADLGVSLQNFIEPIGARASLARASQSYSTGSCDAFSFLRQHATPIALKAGETLFRPGDAADGCYWVQSGVLVISVVGQGGSERIVSMVGRGRLVGTLALIDAKARSTIARTLTPCQFGYITRAAFGEAIRRDASVRDFAMREMAAATRQVLERSAVASLPSARARVASAILTFVSHLGKEVGEDIVEVGGIVRQADIAAMASVTRESVSRILGQWRREGILLSDQGNRLRLRRSLVGREVDVDA